MDNDLVSRYNYDSFVPEKFGPWMRFGESPVLGKRSPDFPLWQLDGDEYQSACYLSTAYLHRRRIRQLHLTILRDGGAIHECNCRPVRCQDVGSIFLYTNEAHPGENYPHHHSMQQKQAHAEALRDVLGVTRPILSGRP